MSIVNENTLEQGAVRTKIDDGTQIYTHIEHAVIAVIGSIYPSESAGLDGAPLLRVVESGGREAILAAHAEEVEKVRQGG